MFVNLLPIYSSDGTFGELSGSSGWGWFGRVIPMSVLRTSLNNDFLLKISDDIVQLVAAFICIQR